MCGILGIARSDPADLRAMLDAMAHRGPDDQGVWRSADGAVILGQRRLAIIDLTEGGHQPMLDPSGTTCVTYNGEIYNFKALREELCSQGHTFRSQSDTEVLLRAYAVWGTDCVCRFNGMFAFGLYDSGQHRLFLARDRAGEKPLYYWRNGDGLVFASELKALMADPRFPRRLDGEAMEHYLAFGYVPGDRCIFEGVHKLPPAHAMTFDLRTGAAKIWRYWELPEPAPEENAETLLEELEELLLDAVRLRLVADVPVAVLLSGGLDSSLVAAMAARSAPDIRTFTISFPGHKGIDEAPFARLVARHLGTQHTELPAEPATVELLPTLARQFDEPMADSSMVPTHLVSRLVRGHATVALGGDGGDELFAGYNHYSLLALQARVGSRVPLPIRRLISRLAAKLPAGVKGRNHLIGLSADLPRSIAHVNLYFDAETRARLLSGRRSPHADHGPEAYKASLCSSRHSWLQQATRVDFLSTMAEAYLVKVDRASMLCSLEVRAPWLDHRLVEFAFRRVPDRWRANTFERKVLPKRLARKLLPSELDLHRKQGFSMPLDAWFQGKWGAYLEEILLDPSQDMFAHGEVRALLAGQRRGRANMNRLFALALFELWRREYKIAA